MLESGSGWFGRVNFADGRFEPLCFCPGYPRGLAFHGHYAVIGLSLPRAESGFAGMALDTELAWRERSLICGLLVVDLTRMEILFHVEMVGAVQELYDVAVLSGVRRPRWIGPDSEDLHYLLSIGPVQAL